MFLNLIAIIAFLACHLMQRFMSVLAPNSAVVIPPSSDNSCCFCA